MGAPFNLKVVLHSSQLDARRGVVRLHPDLLPMIGIRVWDTIAVQGTRLTGALVALAPDGASRDEILLDDLMCANAGVVPGQMVGVGHAFVAPANEVRISGGPPNRSGIDPDALRFALLGKVMAEGDHVSLLPQDFTRTDGHVGDAQLAQLLQTLSSVLGDDWKRTLFQVSSVHPLGLVRVSMGTAVSWDDGRTTTTSSTFAAPGRATPPTLEELPGMEAPAAALRERLDVGFNRVDLLAQLGTRPQMGVLVTGPPGSGKVAMVEAVAAAVGASVVRVWGPAIARVEPDEGRKQLLSAVASVESKPPGLLLIEDVDAIAPRTDQGPLVSVVLETVERLVTDGRVAVVCTTAHPETTCPDLRAPGRLEQEIQIPTPQRETRLQILSVQTRSVPLEDDVRLDDVAAATPGYVAADLMALCREAALRAAHRLATAAGGTPTGPVTVSNADFKAALEVVRPSVMDQNTVDVGTTTLDDVGDMEQVKKVLTETVVWPLTYPDTFSRLGVEPARGVLLYGPPGCGKTFLLRAIAATAQVNFFSIKGSELLSKWVGESEASVRDLFRRARAAAPVLIFFDEIDALAPVRGQSTDGGVTDRVVAALLTELDGVEALQNVFVVGATNRPDLVDPALLRPGRLDRMVYVPPPDVAARSAILSAAARAMPLSPDVDLVAIATECEGYSGADLAGLLREAAMTAMRENIQSPQVTADHVHAAMKNVRPSLRPEQVAALEGFAAARAT